MDAAPPLLYVPLPGAADEGAANGTVPREASAPSILHRSSSRLLRAASSTFTGGAAVLPPSTAEESSRANSRPSMRRMGTTTVQQRMMEEIWAQYRYRIMCLLLLIFFFSFAMTFLLMQALYAEILYGSLPCDQPLGYYFLTSFCIGQTSPQIVKSLLRQPWAQRRNVIICISMVGSMPGWIVIIWGMTMVLSCKTCQETNPRLYYPTKYFIYGQVVLFLLTTLCFSVGFTGLLSYASTIADRVRPGCQKAVSELPQVPNGDPELIDPEDGSVLECPICAESFSIPKAVVRTKCNHHFHLACLERWCKNHMDCPMCRAEVGEPDNPGASSICQEGTVRNVLLPELPE